MTDKNTPLDKGGEQKPAQDQQAFGALTTSGEVEVVKAKKPEEKK